MHRKVKKPNRLAATQILLSASLRRCSTLNALVAQSKERRTSNAGDPGGRPGEGATLGGSVTKYDTTGLHPVEYGEIP